MDKNRKYYSYGKQTILDDDIKEVQTVLKSNWMTQGPIIKKFEHALCNKFGAKYTTVVSSGTAALHLTAIALGWKRNDIILTTPLTFLSTANCILYAGATPDFADIDEVSYTINIDKLEDKIRFYRKKQKNIKAIIGVDYAGHPCDWKELRKLANKYRIQLVNDNCHSLGAEYEGDSEYAVKYADVVCHSYHPVKHITTGEGGAVLTKIEKVDSKIKILRTHGIVKNFSKNQKPPWYYEMKYLGFNYRITDFQCALGISQLKKLDDFVSKRRKIAEIYNNAFNRDERFIIPRVSERVKHSYHLYPLQIKFDIIKNKKKNIYNELLQKKINCQVHYIPIHLQPYYRKKFGFNFGDFPIAEKFYQHIISIPLYPSLSDSDIEYIIRNIKKIVV